MKKLIRMVLQIMGAGTLFLLLVPLMAVMLLGVSCAVKPASRAASLAQIR